MEKISQQHIKWENTHAVFSAIAQAGSISRAEVAEQTGLSLMTVGKVADVLDNLGIVSQEKDERISAGRKARLLTCNPDWHLFVLDLTAVNFRLSVLDLSLKVIDNIVYRYDEGLFCEENLVLFLKNLPIYQSVETDPDYCIGAGVLLPGAYDAENDRIYGSRLSVFSPMRPRTLLTDLLPAPRILLIEDICASAIANPRSVYEDKKQSQLRILLDRPVSGTLLVNGQPVLGAHNCAGRFGEITVGSGFTLDQAMITLTDPAERASAIAIALYSLIAALDPASILLESHTQPQDEAFLQMVQTRLTQLNVERAIPLPTITMADSSISSAVLGIAATLREEWLRKMLDR